MRVRLLPGGHGGYGVAVNTAGCGPADESSTLSSHPWQNKNGLMPFLFLEPEFIDKPAEEEVMLRLLVR